MDRNQAETFFETDEPIEKIKAIVDRGPSGYTTPPGADLWDLTSLTIGNIELTHEVPAAFEVRHTERVTVSGLVRES
jgi:hypothetical protein